MGCAESKTDAELKPANARGCTDVFWLIAYIAFWFLMIAIAVFAFVYGDPVRLINGYDSFGNTCGVRSNERFADQKLSGQNTIDRPNVFFLDIKEWRNTIKVCVRQCPTERLNNQSQLYNFYEDTGSQLCRYDFNMTLLKQPEPSGMQFFNVLGPCPPFPVYEGTPILHRCIPTGKKAPGETIRTAYEQLNSWSISQQLLNDVYTTWPVMVSMYFVALVLSIVVIAMMNWVTNIIAWFICVFVTVASIAISVILWLTYYDVVHNEDRAMEFSQFEEFIRNENALYAMAIIASIVAVLIIIAVCLMHKRLSGLSALFEEASNCMLSLPGLIVPSLIAVVVLALFLTFWVAVVICLATANYPDMRSLLSSGPTNYTDAQLLPGKELNIRNNSDTVPDYKSFRLVEYYDVDWLRQMLWIYLIGLIWTSEFIFACQQLTLAGAVAFWYFRKPTDSPVLHSLGKLLKYHLGSVAKGSLLITLLKVPRLILMFLYTKLKKSDDRGSQCAKRGMECCVCCFWFLEKFLRYLNHNAYTVIAIENINFCPAAGVAWNAMMANSIQVATINGVGDFILFLGKLAVGIVCGAISVLLLRHREDIHFYMIPCIVVAVFAFLIAHVILSLYEMVVDTLFLCVVEDRTINGTNGRWKESNLAHLLGEEPVEEAHIQTVEMMPINKQPFSSHA